MPTRREGDTGARVKLLQYIVGAVQDGDFGPRTRAAVERWQRAIEVPDDGIFGPRTWDATYRQLETNGSSSAVWRRQKIVRFELPNAPGAVQGLSYRHLRLCESAADALSKVQASLESRGASLTTSGGTRSLGANVSRNRSATSRHYLGGAIDLGVYTGMARIDSDPFLVERDRRRERYFRVWARVQNGGRDVPVEALDRSGNETQTVAHVVDVTRLFEVHGFTPIPCRRSTWASLGKGTKINNPGGLEWWHFERAVPKAVRGETTWGEALLGVYRLSQLIGTKPWANRHAVYGRDWG